MWDFHIIFAWVGRTLNLMGLGGVPCIHCTSSNEQATH